MSYTEEQARELIIKAGHILTEKKLIARTWGNISARIGDNEFVITPSGRAYDTLTPEQLVKVRIDDLKYEGDIKPSSEKGIHASSYALRPDVNFVVHTHQLYASAVCAEGKDTFFAPCAAYGLPGTKKLRENVEKAIREHEDKYMFLMAKHGALCLGKSMENAFFLADKLEELSKVLYKSRVDMVKIEPSSLSCLGLENKFGYVIRDTDPTVMAASAERKNLRAYLDDFAQMVGRDARLTLADANMAETALRGRNAVLLKYEGALCVAENEEDAEAVSMILRKNCAAALYVNYKNPIGFLDARLQRTMYLLKYSKQKDKK